MKKIALLLLALALYSCNDKEVLLPQVDKTLVADVEDHSPVYLFFKTDGKDTLVEVNRKNTISSTNWIFNIDKRLPLRLVVPEVIQLQAKKEGSMHKSETSENYYSYSDSVHKKLAFMLFTSVRYQMAPPKAGENCLYFTKDDSIRLNTTAIAKKDLQSILDHLTLEKESKLYIAFDKKMSYGNYIKTKAFLNDIKLHTLGLSWAGVEYVY